MAEDRKEGTKPRPWVVLGEEECGDFEIFRVRRLRARSPVDGEEHVFNLAQSPDGVAVIALTDDGRMVMVEQFRHPLGRVTLETPAGIVDEGERPEDAAARELREETGFAGDAAEILGTVELNPSWQRSRVHVAVVRNARRAGPKDEDPAEDIRCSLLPVADLDRRIRAGDVEAAAVLSAIALWRSAGGA
ncbi:MAG TPA: NUDIX hydrolase [Longimicrobium sp.]|nr:NUDIX hydrolase [Longimicrobium sp.]